MNICNRLKRKASRGDLRPYVAAESHWTSKKSSISIFENIYIYIFPWNNEVITTPAVVGNQLDYSTTCALQSNINPRMQLTVNHYATTRRVPSNINPRQQIKSHSSLDDKRLYHSILSIHTRTTVLVSICFERSVE